MGPPHIYRRERRILVPLGVGAYSPLARKPTGLLVRINAYTSFLSLYVLLNQSQALR